MRNKKILSLLVLILSFTVIITGCSAKSHSYDKSTQEIAPSAPPQEMDSSAVESEDEVIKQELGGYGGYEKSEKIIKTVSISMQTKEFIDTTDKLNDLIAKYKGYIENSDISYNNYIYGTRLKYGNYSIRIPQESLDKFLDELKEVGNIISENTSKSNITKQYQDTKSRLNVLEIKEKRILALLEKAEKMEDIIALENQLSTIIYEKESLTANIMDMDDKVNYSTAHIQVEEVAKLTPGETVKTPFWTKVGNAFKDSIYFFTNNIENLIISLIYFLPYGLIIGVVAYIALRFMKGKKNNTPRE